MAAYVFKLYSTAPTALFAFVGQAWPDTVVRRSGWKVAGSSVFYVTIVLDHESSARSFEHWLGANAYRADIRPRLRKLDHDVLYSNVLLHESRVAMFYRRCTNAMISLVRGHFNSGAR